MRVKSSQSTIRPVHYILLVLPLFLIGWIGGWSQAIKRGNAHYQAEAYDAALEAYQSAAEDRPEDAISRYNLGTALYQKKQFEEASDEFRRSLDAEDPIHRAQGYYNLGNAQVQLNDMEGAIRSYKSALRLNPADLEAKHNLELALERLEQQSQQNRSESGDKDKDQQEQDQQQQNQEQGDRDEQETDQQDQEDPSESEQEQQNQGSSEQEAASEESPPQPEQESAQQPVEMSEEDAIRLLEAVKDNEKEIQKKILQKRFSRRQRSEKDW
jgi:tetratricopeptide (TPR) repeat protein